MKYLGKQFETIDVHGIKCSGTCVSEHENVIILDTGYVVHKSTVNPNFETVISRYIKKNTSNKSFDLEQSHTLKKFPCDFKYNGYHMSPKYGEVHSVIR